MYDATSLCTLCTKVHYEVASYIRCTLFLSSDGALRDNKEEATLFDISDDFRIGKYTNYSLHHFVERVKIYDDEKFNYKFYNINLKNE